MGTFAVFVGRRSRRAVVLVGIGLAGAVLVACSGGTGADQAPDGQGAAAHVSLAPGFTVGCSDCGTSEQITPTVITLYADGRLVVLDRFEPFVRVFSPAGEAELAFGAPGQGPGELGGNVGGLNLPGVYLLPWQDGGISVLELMPVVLETFSSTGEFVRQETLDLPFAAPGAQAFSAATSTYFRHSYLPMSQQPDVIERCTVALQGDSRCEQISTASALTGTEPEGFRATLSLASTPSGELIVADAATYRLWLLDESGTVRREFGRDIPPPAKSAEQLEAEAAANRTRRERGQAEREIDPNRPYLSAGGLQVDGHGRIWTLTQRYTADEWVFDVFDGDGTFRNEVAVAATTVANGYQVTPFAAAGDHLAMIAEQPDGSARIDVYRIVETPR